MYMYMYICIEMKKYSCIQISYMYYVMMLLTLDPGNCQTNYSLLYVNKHCQPSYLSWECIFEEEMVITHNEDAEKHSCACYTCICCRQF